jgi:hypothetical protein
MHDEIDGRLWAEHAPAFSEQVILVLREIGRSWQRLQNIRYQAPWQASRRSRCC